MTIWTLLTTITKMSRYIFDKPTKTTDLMVKTNDNEIIYTYKAHLILYFEYYDKLFNGSWADSNKDKIEVDLTAYEFKTLMACCCDKIVCIDNPEVLPTIFMFAHKHEGKEVKGTIINLITSNDIIDKITTNPEIMETIFTNISLYGPEVETRLIENVTKDMEKHKKILITKSVPINLIYSYFDSDWGSLIAALNYYIDMIDDSPEAVDKIIEELASETSSYHHIDKISILSIVMIMKNATQNEKFAYVSYKLNRALLRDELEQQQDYSGDEEENNDEEEDILKSQL